MSKVVISFALILGKDREMSSSSILPMASRRSVLKGMLAGSTIVAPVVVQARTTAANNVRPDLIRMVAHYAELSSERDTLSSKMDVIWDDESRPGDWHRPDDFGAWRQRTNEWMRSTKWDQLEDQFASLSYELFELQEDICYLPCTSHADILAKVQFAQNWLWDDGVSYAWQHYALLESMTLLATAGRQA